MVCASYWLTLLLSAIWLNRGAAADPGCRHQRDDALNRSVAFEVKGWCPGALRPMQSGDGLIVRVRPQSASLRPQDLGALADAARQFGNGHIDLTRRANLQIRGVRETSLSDLHDVIARLGLLDASAEGEAIRNIMINPLAGIDPTEACDVRPIAGELARWLTSDRSLWALPSKFGFIIDGGGVLSLGEQRADVRLVAMGAQIAIGIETRAGIEWLGLTAPGAAAAAATEIGVLFIKAASRDKRHRMRDLSDEGIAAIRAAMRLGLDTLHEHPRKADVSPDRIGLIELGHGKFAVGIAAPFGRVESDQLRNLTDVMTSHGVGEIRLSPWRALYAAVSSRQSRQFILDAAAREGLITDPRDPLLQIEACPGSPGCRSTVLDTRGDGRRLAALLPQSGFAGTVHVSGCAKGCAKSGAADLVLIGSEGRYGIARNGTAQDQPAGRFTFEELAADPGKMFELEGPRHE
jgi:precorrin-3B synthase